MLLLDSKLQRVTPKQVCVYVCVSLLDKYTLTKTMRKQHTKLIYAAD